MIVFLLVLLGWAPNVGAEEYPMEGHFSIHGGSVYFSLDARAASPEFAVDWDGDPPRYKTLCFYNLNHACRRMQIRVKDVRLAERKLVGVRVLPP